MPTNSDFQDIAGQEHVKRALEVCAAGGHPILLSGSPGSGKTMLTRALHSILPPLTDAEREAVDATYTDAAMEPRAQRPRCLPHASTSLRGLLGGSGRRGGPGLLTLAQHGMLVLDDLPAFSAKLTPIAEHLDGANGDAPPPILLVATMPPCPCGWHGDVERQCPCSPALISRYLRRIPPSFFDRIDIHVDVPRLGYEKLLSQRLGEPSSAVRERVIAARERQQCRFGECCITTNAAMGPAQLREHCRLDGAGRRGAARCAPTARTIADLAGADLIGAAHLAEAVQYRPRRVE